MAIEVIRKLICDVGERHDGTHTLSFAVSGQTYEIDVCDKHGKAFDRDMETWTQAGRAVSSDGRRRKRREPVATKAPAYNAEAVRTWAKLSGIPISDTGRIGPTTIKKWREAGSPGL